MTSPANRTAFVSGASTGVGYGIACALAQAGYDLAVTSRDAARLDALMKEPAMKGRKVVPVKLDVRVDGDIAKALAGINNYPPGGYVELCRAIAGYNGVEPENVVLGVGADDLILLCARCYAGPGDTIAIPDAPTYPLYRLATLLAGAELGDEGAVLTFTCRPNSPDGGLRPLPEARPLVVDEAYFEYSGETALPLIDGPKRFEARFLASLKTCLCTPGA